MKTLSNKLLATAFEVGNVEGYKVFGADAENRAACVNHNEVIPLGNTVVDGFVISGSDMGEYHKHKSQYTMQLWTKTMQRHIIILVRCFIRAY